MKTIQNQFTFEKSDVGKQFTVISHPNHNFSDNEKVTVIEYINPRETLCQRTNSNLVQLMNPYDFKEASL